MEYGKKLITSGLTTGTGGNLSIFNREEGLVAISPSGMDYFDITPEDVVVIDLHGNVVDRATERLLVKCQCTLSIITKDTT